MRAALYTRVSTRDKGQEAANQVNQLREFCAAQGWPIANEYEDHESGGKADRAQFRAMMTDAAKREFDVLVFWALDRFSREGVYETHLHLKRLDDAGVRFRSFSEPYLDSCGMFRDAVISILAVIAKQERIRISERVRSGLSRARAQGTRSGKPVGRPRVVFDRGKAVELRNVGRSWRDIARACGVGVTTVRRACSSMASTDSGLPRHAA